MSKFERKRCVFLQPESSAQTIDSDIDGLSVHAADRAHGEAQMVAASEGGHFTKSKINQGASVAHTS